MEKDRDVPEEGKTHLNWVMRTLISAASRGFYGEFTVKMADGKVTQVLRIESLKPPKS